MLQTHVLCSIFSFLYLLFFIAIGCARGLKCGSQPVVHAQSSYPDSALHSLSTRWQDIYTQYTPSISATMDT